MTRLPPTALTDAAGTWNRRFQGEDSLFGTEPNAWLKANALAASAGVTESFSVAACDAHAWPAAACDGLVARRR